MTPSDSIKIPRHAVRSGYLGAIGYDAPKRILAIEFVGGTVFHYAEVPPPVVEKFLSSESLGSYYHANIRGKYPGQRMTGPCGACGAQGWVGETCDECGCATFTAVERKAANG